MKVVRETAVAGKTIYQNIKVPSGCHGGCRRPRRQISKDAVRKNNKRNAIRKLTLLMNANFDETCAHFTLTYAGDPPAKEEAAKDRESFIRRLRRRFAKEGEELKYIGVTEYENHRIHHHLLLNTQDVALIARLWGKGHVRITALDDTGNYRKLAEYFVKETDKTFRLPDSVHKQRYTCSRNLVMPELKRELVDPRVLSEDPKPVKGYYIPPDEIRRYEHPVTGIEHIEYIMVAQDKPRKRWNRGVPVPIHEYFKADYDEVQLELDLTDGWSWIEEERNAVQRR